MRRSRPRTIVTTIAVVGQRDVDGEGITEKVSAVRIYW